MDIEVALRHICKSWKRIPGLLYVLINDMYYRKYFLIRIGGIKWSIMQFFTLRRVDILPLC